MRSIRSFIDSDHSNYLNLESVKSPSKLKTYEFNQNTILEDSYYFRKVQLEPKNQYNKDQNYQLLRQTYDSGFSNFRSDLRSYNGNNNKPDKFLRSTINGNIDDIYQKKPNQQLTGSYVGQWRNMKSPDNTSSSYKQIKNNNNNNNDYISNSSQSRKRYKQIRYDQIGQKLQKSAQIIDQIKKIKQQRILRMQSKKLQQLNQLKSLEIQKIDQRQKIFSKKDYIQYYTPKFDKVAYQQRFKQKQNNNSQTRNRLRTYNDKSKTPTKRQKSKTPTKITKPLIQQNYINQFNIINQRNRYSSPTRKWNQKLSCSIYDFNLGKCLGQGKFGNVYMATHKVTKSIYAIKKIPKNMIRNHLMIDQFLLQVKLQSFMNHQNILTINGLCDDTDNIYLVLEYMEEGTLFKLLKTKKVLDEKQASIYLKQIAQAVKYIHENGIAHRDIKPQNIVMSNGVCKLCDFGWATVCNQRRKTYCGTFDYAAPQILEGIQYDMSVDLWCLGVLAYQLMVGKAPFYHTSRKQTIKRIINVDITAVHYPQKLSKQAVSFIDSLIRKNPDERMRSDSLLNHPFLAPVNSDYY